MPEPIDNIEQRHAFQDMARLAVNAYRGAIDEADGDHELATRATTALLAAMLHGKPSEAEDTA